MTTGNLNRAVRQLLEDWRSAGLTHLPKPSPRADVAPEIPVDPPAELAPSPSAKTFPAENIQDVPPAKSLLVSPSSTASREERVDALKSLASCVAGCVRCKELADTRKQTVFGVGNPEARVMFIGEAPGADEDAQGEPFVGRAGQLLNRIIAACGWAREDVYICNILRCRPPGNRTPAPQEAANCREWLDGQIAIIDPEFIVCWGSCAAQNLLGMTDAIGKMRQRFFKHGRAKVLCTYHPSYLLRNPEAKKPVWDDMLLLLKEMGLKAPVTPGQ
jgi:uracil-DNA glycosylase